MKKALMIMYMAVAASTAQSQSPLSFYTEAGIGTSRLYGNYCIARMYSIEMACHQHLQEELPACLKKEIEKIEAKG